MTLQSDLEEENAKFGELGHLILDRVEAVLVRMIRWLSRG